MEYVQLQDPGRSSGTPSRGGLRGVADTLETLAAWSVDNALVVGAIVAGVVAAVILWRMLTRGGLSKL